MPHQCTACNHVFADGSKEMLSGCPECGGNKFQFQPAGRDVDDQSSSSIPTGSDESADGSVSTNANATGSTNVGHTDTEEAASSDPFTTVTAPTDQRDETDAVGEAGDTDGTERVPDRGAEDTAQATARSDVVSPDELARASRGTFSSRSGSDASNTANDAQPSGSTDAPATRDDRPDIDDLRAELNDQFESIRIVSPGQYELNLMELYDRQEYIISLQEDGRYVIEMPDGWGIDDE